MQVNALRRAYCARSIGSARCPRAAVRPSRARPWRDSAEAPLRRPLPASSLVPYARRVVIKSRIVNLRQVTPQAVAAHLRYIAREGVGHDGQPTQPYGPDTDAADRQEFAAAGRQDRHQFRFIVAPEDGVELADLRDFTRELMATMERDLGTKLEWIAVDHWDTDNPHTHVVLRGTDDRGKDLIIARAYLTDGMRLRAGELSTEWLGLRTEREIQERLQRDVSQERWTGLDRQLQALARDGAIDLARPDADGAALQQRSLLLGRLQVLAGMGLAREQGDGSWELSTEVETTLRALGERGDIIKTMHRALRGQRRELVLFVRRFEGTADRRSHRGDRIRGRARRARLCHRRRHRRTGPPPADRQGGLGRVSGRRHRRNTTHATQGGGSQYCGDAPRTASTRLRNIARSSWRERTPTIDPTRSSPPTSGGWRHCAAPASLNGKPKASGGFPRTWWTQGHAYDRQRTGGVDVQLHSHLPIDKQVTAMGATWLDQTLVERRRGDRQRWLWYGREGGFTEARRFPG